MSGLVQRPGLILFCLAILVGSVAALRADVTPHMVTPVSIVAIIAIVLGEQLPLRIAGRVIAPLTTAPALGLILSPLSFGGEAPSAWTVLAVVWLSILAGGLVARARGLSVVEGSLGSRFLGMVVTTLLARGIVSDGQTLVEWAFDERTRTDGADAAPGREPATEPTPSLSRTTSVSHDAAASPGAAESASATEAISRITHRSSGSAGYGATRASRSDRTEGDAASSSGERGASGGNAHDQEGGTR